MHAPSLEGECKHAWAVGRRGGGRRTRGTETLRNLTLTHEDHAVSCQAHGTERY